MSFPKVPRKPVTGRLNLTVRPADVEVVVEASDQTTVPDAPDLAGTLDFKLPRGFTLSTDPSEIILEQRALMYKKLDALRAKRETCAACKRATSERMISVVEDVVGAVTDSLLVQSITVKIDFRQEKDGTLVTYFETPTKTLGLKVLSSVVETGYYLPSGLSNEKRCRITDFTLDKDADWLAT